jgi:hypothetical protein
MPRALALGKVPWHWRLMVPLLSVLRDGYSIRAFKPR